MPRKDYCIIYPKQALLDQLKFLEDPDAGSLFDSPILWEKDALGSRSIIYLDDIRVGIKLIFLLTLYKEYSGSVQSFVYALLGEPPFTPEVFDKWWHIYYCQDIEATIDEVFDGLLSMDFEMIAAPNHPDAIAWVKDQKAVVEKMNREGTRVRRGLIFID